MGFDSPLVVSTIQTKGETMIGDSLSDCHAKILSEIGGIYGDEYRSLPASVRYEICTALYHLDRARAAVDHYQIVGCFDEGPSDG